MDDTMNVNNPLYVKEYDEDEQDAAEGFSIDPDKVKQIRINEKINKR